VPLQECVHTWFLYAVSTFLLKEEFSFLFQDVEEFSKALKNVRVFLVSDPKFNHGDFIISTYADELVYKPLLRMVDEIRSI